MKYLTSLALFIKRFPQKMQRISARVKLIFSKKKLILENDLNLSIKNIENVRPRLPIDMGQPLKKERTCELSIIIPVYNSQDFIKDCIDSVLKQNIKYSYEIICVNDGSTDNSLKILQSYNKKIKIITTPNQGLSVARNTGLANSNGKYIFFIDSDDIIPDNTINKMIEIAISTDVDIVAGQTERCNYNAKYIYSPKKQKDIITEDYKTACNNCNGCAWGKLYKYHLWENIRFFKGYSFEDIIVFLNIFSQAKSFYIFGTPVYRLRSRKSSLFSTQLSSVTTVDSLWSVLGCIENMSLLNDSRKQYFYQLILFHLSNVMYGRIKVLNNESLLQDSFIVASDIIYNFKNQNNLKSDFFGKNAKIYELVEKSFLDKDFLLWEKCSNALNTGDK